MTFPPNRAQMQESIIVDILYSKKNFNANNPHSSHNCCAYENNVDEMIHSAYCSAAMSSEKSLNEG